MFRCETCQKDYTTKCALLRHQKRSKICNIIKGIKQPEPIISQCEKMGIVLVPNNIVLKSRNREAKISN